MRVIDYRRDCLLLCAAAVLVVFSGRLPIPPWIPRPTFLFGLIGALHALALVAALNSAATLPRRIAFVSITVPLSVLAPLAGFSLARIAGSLGEIAFFLALILASAFGASTYWLLIRWSWIGTLRYESLGFTVALCALTTPIAFIGAAALTGFGRRQEGALSLIADAIPTVAWWCAFSYSLYLGENFGRSANSAFQRTLEDSRR